MVTQNKVDEKKGFRFRLIHTGDFHTGIIIFKLTENPPILQFQVCGRDINWCHLGDLAKQQRRYSGFSFSRR